MTTRITIAEGRTKAISKADEQWIADMMWPPSIVNYRSDGQFYMFGKHDMFQKGHTYIVELTPSARYPQRGTVSTSGYARSQHRFETFDQLEDRIEKLDDLQIRRDRNVKDGWIDP